MAVSSPLIVPSPPLAKERVITYIDGYNLYFGLREKIHVKDPQGKQPNLHWKRYVWLDVVQLSQSLLHPNQVLLRTKYFTSRIRGKPESEKRQSLFLEATAALPNIKIYYGAFHPENKRCQKCGEVAFHPQEKKTDVNIATQILNDAIHNNFDVAYLISGDSDQVPTIQMTRMVFKKKVVVVFPPKRASAELQNIANSVYRLGEAKFKLSLLPEKVKLPSGKEIECPPKWLSQPPPAAKP
jgi:uncharacterized LabA/DUF88 family protein